MYRTTARQGSVHPHSLELALAEGVGGNESFGYFGSAHLDGLLQELHSARGVITTWGCLLSRLVPQYVRGHGAEYFSSTMA